VAVDESLGVVIGCFPLASLPIRPDDDDDDDDDEEGSVFKDSPLDVETTTVEDKRTNSARLEDSILIL